MSILDKIHKCVFCANVLPHKPRPVIAAGKTSKIVIIGQAPGRKVHETGIPWNDPSGDLLRYWMQIDKKSFYDTKKISLIPMGFCYPGKGKSGDLPPRPECAPLWHQELLSHIVKIKLIVLIGQYSQRHYLGNKATVTDNVRNYKKYLPSYFPLPHPSPRNRLWLKKNPWFADKILPDFQNKIQSIL